MKKLYEEMFDLFVKDAKDYFNMKSKIEDVDVLSFLEDLIIALRRFKEL